MRYILIGTLVMSIMACGSGEEPAKETAPTVINKDLFSNWLGQSGGTTVALDLRSVVFGSQVYSFYLSGGGACECAMNISGVQSSGTIILASCLFVNLGTSATDPGCSGLDGARTYVKSSDTLTICRLGTCVDYR